MSVAEALAGIRNLGSVASLRDAAARGNAPAAKVNAHIHLPPNFSAFTTVQQAVDMAAKEGVGVLGASNYYDYAVYGTFATLARQRGIFPLFGLEIICLLDDLKAAGVKINDPGNPGKMYLCGKGITRFADMTPEAARLLNKIRSADSARTDGMVRQIENVFAQRGLPTGTDTAGVIDMIVKRHGSPRDTVYLQERHVAQAFQEAAFAKVPAAERIAKINDVFGAPTKAKNADDAVTVQNDLRSSLMKAGKPGYVEETFIGFDEAYRLIHELGGFACYPVLADGASPVTAFEGPVETLIANIKARQIHAAEFIPLRNDLNLLIPYVKAMRAAGLVVTAGTEHNTLDLIPIEVFAKGNAAIPADIQAIFWEGACVVAAHQFLTLHGETGFVDAAGKANGAYKTAEERIAAFAKLGAAVIAAYRAGK